MSGLPKHELLAQDIAAALESGYARATSSRALLLTGIALACFQPGQAEALTLGELKVESTIGQPLLSTTTARIATGESLAAGCVTSVANPQGGLSLPNDLIVTVPETSVAGVHPVRITSARPLYEPMYEIRLQVNCPGNVSLARSYVVMLNVPMTSPQTQPVSDNLQPVLQANKPQTKNPAQQTPLVASTQQTVSQEVTQEVPQEVPQEQRKTSEAPAPAVQTQAPDQSSDTAPMVETDTPTAAVAESGLRPYTERFPTPMEPITADVEYRIQAGDTLSTIAQRIQGRPANTTWEVAAKIHQLNPDAFVGNDPNLVKLGSVINIPPVEELLGQEMVAMRPNPDVIADKQVNTPAIEQVVDIPAESSVETQGNEIVATEIQAEPEPVADTTPELSASVIATPEATETLAEETIVADQDVEVEVEAETPAPLTAQVPALIAGDTDVSETEILVDRSLLESLPDQETIEPIAEAEVRKLEAYEPETAAIQGDTEAAPEDTSLTIHPLLAAGLGALPGCIIALMMFGKRLLARIFPNHATKRNANAIDALDLPDGLSDTVNQEQPDFGADTDVVAEPEDTDVTDTDVVAESDVTDTDVVADADDTQADVVAETTEEEPEMVALPAAEDIGAGTNTDVDLDISATAENAINSLDFDLTALEADGEQGDANHVDLLDINATIEEETPLEKTERFTGPDFSTDGVELEKAPTELDDTGTMRQLFSEEADKRKAEQAENSNEFDVTQEMPELTGEANVDATSDLQSLADNVGLNNPNDDLSATLTQALGLLEQDYEEEFSESQILEQSAIENAIAEHSKKG